MSGTDMLHKYIHVNSPLAATVLRRQPAAFKACGRLICDNLIPEVHGGERVRSGVTESARQWEGTGAAEKERGSLMQ